MRSLIASFLFAGVLLTGACATRYEVKIDSSARGDLRSRGVASFQIHHKQGDPEATQLRFKEAANHIRTALSARGLFEAAEPQHADMLVEVDYHLGPARTTYVEIETPVYGDSGLSRRPPVLVDSNELVSYERWTLPLVVRVKHLSVAGYEIQPRSGDSPPRELWWVDVSIEDESRDLRAYLPLLASAAMDRIGQNTDGPMTTTLRADDEAIRFIRKGMSLDSPP